MKARPLDRGPMDESLMTKVRLMAVRLTRIRSSNARNSSSQAFNHKHSSLIDKTRQIDYNGIGKKFIASLIKLLPSICSWANHSERMGRKAAGLRGTMAAGLPNGVAKHFSGICTLQWTASNSCKEPRRQLRESSDYGAFLVMAGLRMACQVTSSRRREVCVCVPGKQVN